MTTQKKQTDTTDCRIEESILHDRVVVVDEEAEVRRTLMCESPVGKAISFLAYDSSNIRIALAERGDD
jgi:hypothetical protein